MLDQGRSQIHRLDTGGESQDILKFAFGQDKWFNRRRACRIKRIGNILDLGDRRMWGAQKNVMNLSCQSGNPRNTPKDGVDPMPFIKLRLPIT